MGTMYSYVGSYSSTRPRPAGIKSTESLSVMSHPRGNLGVKLNEETKIKRFYLQEK